jgi:hypothetical protein
MKCVKCCKQFNNEANSDFCDSCFIKVIDKRVRKYARMHNLLPAKKIINCEGELTYYIVQKIMQNIPCTIKKISDTKKIEEVSLHYIDWTMDDELNLFLTKIAKEGFVNSKESEKSSILKVITDEEALKYSKILGIDFKPNKKDEEILDFLNSFQTRYKETKHSFFKGVEKIKNIL